MYFISDLDKTIIYSKKGENSVCVEHKGEKEVTHMTFNAKMMFDELLSDANFCFIPCTLRSVEQTKRIDFIKNRKMRYMICDNGASIYVDEKLDEEWDSILSAIIDKKEVALCAMALQNYSIKNMIPIYMIKSNRDYFISIIFHNKEEHDEYIDELLNLIKNSPVHFKVFKQEKKTYLVPVGLNKDVAVAFLKKKYQLENIITSGDSSVDDMFVELGDKKIIPSHATFTLIDAIITKESGIRAGEEIIKFIQNTLKNSRQIS